MCHDWWSRRREREAEEASELVARLRAHDADRRSRPAGQGARPTRAQAPEEILTADR